MKMTAEHRARISASNMGRKVSPETRTKISTAMRGKKTSLGRHLSELTRLKIGMKSANRSAETKAKLSANNGMRGKTGPLHPNWKGGLLIAWRRHDAKRRTLGFVPLNSPFRGCEAHHINPKDVIHVPKVLHQSIRHNQQTGQGMAAMNALAGQYLTQDWT
jgi:hypothetical protein